MVGWTYGDFLTGDRIIEQNVSGVLNPCYHDLPPLRMAPGRIMIAHFGSRSMRLNSFSPLHINGILPLNEMSISVPPWEVLS